MSISFQDPANAQATAMMAAAFGQPKASDGITHLFDHLDAIDQRDMKAIANAAGQPMKVEMHGIGAIKTMSDGTQYRATPNGWQKIEP